LVHLHISYFSCAKAKTNMVPWVSRVLSLRLKGKWSIRQRHRFHSTPSVLSILCRYSTISQNWYNLSLIFTCTNGENVLKGSQSLRFWRFMPKGERVLAQSKRTAPPPYLSKFFNWYIFQIGIMIFNWYIFNISISIYFQLVSIKTLLKAKRRISFRGSFV
jgi:hypothetical protein